MRTLKKATAIMLVVVMMFSTIVGGNTAQAEISESAKYQALVLDQMVTVTVDETNREAYFSFTPQTSDTYIFESFSATSDMDPYVEMYKKTATGMDYVASADDKQGDRNFALGYELMAGETYYYHARLYGTTATGSYQAILKQSPVQRVVFEDVEIVENTNGYINTSGGEEYFHYYNNWVENLKYTITMRDGSIINSTGWDFSYNGTRYSLSTYDNQYMTHWTVGGNNIVTVDILGNKTEVNISIVESPIKAISVAPMTITEKSNGYFVDKGTDKEYYHYYAWNWMERMQYTITLADNSIVNGTGAYFEYNGQRYSFSAADDQSTNHWVANGTYTPTVSLLGHEATVQITVAETPIESIVMQPITIIENSNGYHTSSGPGGTEEFYYYNWYYKMNFVITLKNGERITGNNASGFNYNDQWVQFSWEDDQWNNQWTKGNTYKVKASALGYETEVNVSIVDTPVESVVVQPITIMEGSNGSYTSSGPGGVGEFYYYNWYHKMNFVITLKNGERITGNNTTGFNYNNQWESFSWEDDQWTNHWTQGNTYKTKASIWGYTTEVDVSIVDTPVESVVVQPITIMEGTNGHYTTSGPGPNEEYYRYNWYSSIRNFTVTMKDGTIHTVSDSPCFRYDGQEFYFQQSDNQASNPWTGGNEYTGIATLMGVSAEVQVTIKESPVESIVVEPIVLAEQTNGYWYGSGPGGPAPGQETWYYYRWEDCLQYTINMKDGTKITGRGMNVRINNEYLYFTSFNNDQYSSHWYAGNTYSPSISLFGKDANVSITICEKNQTEGYEYLVQEDSAIIIGCSKEDTVLNIPSVIDGYPVIGITDLTHAMDYAEELIIPDSVTMLSGSIFEWNYDLKKLTIGKGISNIYNEMFIGATCLEEIIVSDENPYYCSVDGVVYDKKMQTLVVFPRAKQGAYTVPNTVTDIECLVNNITYYQVQIDLGNSNTGYAVEDGVIYNADKTIIYACDKTKTGKYVMPNTVTTINEGAFQNCSFSEVVISENVFEIVYAAFSYSMELEKVVLPKNLKKIDWQSFNDCEKLAEADLPSGLEELGGAAFRNTGITGVTIPGTVKQVGYDAYRNTQLSELTLEEGIESIESSAFRETQLKKAVIPDSITHMGGYVFADAPLENVTIGAGLEVISYNAFEGTNLTTVTIPENIAEIGEYAFANSMLEEAIIERNDVYIFEGAFYNCPLKEIDLKDGVIAISDYAFYGNQAESIVIPDSVTDVTYKSFAESKKLLNIDVPDDLESIDGTAFDGTAWWDAQADGLVYLEEYLYGYKGKMPEETEIVVKDGTKLIADYAFNNEIHLKTITIPNSVTGIGWSSFKGCLGLEKVTVAEGNTAYSTNADGTILYDSNKNAIWKKVEQVISPADIFWVSYGMSVEEFLADLQNMVQYVIYVDGSQGWETCAWTADMISGYDSTKPGEQTVIIDYGRLQSEMYIYVEGPETPEGPEIPEGPETPEEPVIVENVSINSLPRKTTYELGETIDLDGLSVAVSYSNGSSEILYDGFIVSGFDSAVAGEQTVVITHEEKDISVEFVVTINESVVVPEIQKAEVLMENAVGKPGDEVQVSISFKEEATIKIIAISDLEYDKEKLELVNAEWDVQGVLSDWGTIEENSGVMTFANNTPVMGNVLTLTFRILDDVADGTCEITYQVIAKEMLESGEEQNLDVAVTFGEITIKNIIKGDLNGDGYVTSDDAIYLLYHTANSDEYPIDQDGDFDGNGRVTSDDAIYLLYHVMLPAQYPINK